MSECESCGYDHNESDYLVEELDRVRAENTELRKLVEEAFDKGMCSDLDYDEWSAQYPVLKEGE